MKILPSRRTVKRWGIGAAIVVGLLLLANGFMAWRVNSRLAAQIAAVRAAGHPASIDELKPAAIPDQDNAAAQVELLATLIKEFGRAQVEFEQTELGEAYDARLQAGLPPTSEQAAAIREIVNSLPELAAGADRVAECAGYASRNDFSLSFHAFIDRSLKIAQEARGLTRFQRWRMLALVDEGQPDEAIRCGIQTLRLSKQFEAEPLLVGYLVALAARGTPIEVLYDALSQPGVSTEQRAALDRMLAELDDPTALQRVFILERAASFEALHTPKDLPGCELPWWAGMVDWSVKRHYLGAYDLHAALIPLLDGELFEVRARLEKAALLETPTEYGVMADLLMPAVTAAIEAHGRLLAQTRSLRCYNALGAFAEEHGRQADSLAELDLPDAAKTDPFTGKPLIARRLDEGWLIYSVMGNGVDDGGDFTDRKDYGVCPAGERRAN